MKTHRASKKRYVRSNLLASHFRMLLLLFLFCSSFLVAHDCYWQDIIYNHDKLPRMSRWGTQLANRTLLEMPSIGSSYFHITLWGMAAKAFTNAAFCSLDKVVALITEPNVNKMTPCFASSMNCFNFCTRTKTITIIDWLDVLLLCQGNKAENEWKKGIITEERRI